MSNTLAPPAAAVVRCACASCGAHVNVASAPGADSILAGCFTCGCAELAPMPGAAPLTDGIFPFDR